jgi:uncharacterized protein (TIGR00369 family)
MERLEPRADNGCFGCGGANPRGMKLAFESDESTRRVTGRFKLGAEYAGGGKFLHGGIIALLLDEAMGKVSRFSGVRAVTADLTVEYRKPVPVDLEIVVEGYEVRKAGRNLWHAGEIRDTTGEVLARGQGRFVNVSGRAEGKTNLEKKQES